MFARIRVLMGCAVIAASAPVVRGQTIVGIGFPNGGTMSPDGRTIVGSSGIGNNDGFKWTSETGVEMLTLGNVHPLDVVNDGSVIVGVLTDEAGLGMAFVSNRGAVTLPLGEVDSMALSISDDGSFVLVWDATQSKAYRWNETGGLLFIADDRFPTGMSSDGTAILLGLGIGNPALSILMWNQASGLSVLDPLPGQNTAAAFGLSADGNVAVGYSFVATVIIPTKWFNGGSPVEMENTGSAFVATVSGDGRTIGGSYLWVDDIRHDMEEYFEFRGVDLSDWCPLGSTPAISDDGLVFVGTADRVGGEQEGWCVILPPTGDFNDDGLTNAIDLPLFDLAVSENSIDYSDRNDGDFNHNGVLDDGDRCHMLELLQMGVCGPGTGGGEFGGGL